MNQPSAQSENQAAPKPDSQPKVAQPKLAQPKLAQPKLAQPKVARSLSRAAAKPQINLTSLIELDSKIDEQILGGQPTYTLLELSELTGWSAEELEQLWLWAGLPTPAQDEPIFNDGDRDGLRALRDLFKTEHLELENLSSMVRGLATTVERLAIWQVEALVKYMAASRNLTDTEARIAAAKWVPAQADMLTFFFRKVWLRHFAAAIHRLTTETVLRRGVSDDDDQFPLVCAVGYAVVSDYMGHTSSYDNGDISRFIRTFHDRVADLINTKGGRIINNAGDSVTYVAPRADIGADIALAIANLQKEGFTASVKGAVTWCRIFSDYGDVFGPGVNLCRTLAWIAPANTVFTDSTTAATLQSFSGYQLEPQPERELDGLGAIQPIKLVA